jgi:hypothetical protein
MKNCIRPHYEKLKPLKSGFIENSNFVNNRDPCTVASENELETYMKPRLVNFRFCPLLWNCLSEPAQLLEMERNGTLLRRPLSTGWK